MKKTGTIAAVLASAMALSMLSMPAFADEEPVKTETQITDSAETGAEVITVGAEPETGAEISEDEASYDEFASESDGLSGLDVMFCDIAKKEYTARTGGTAAGALFKVLQETAEVQITLTDEAGAVLEVYTVLVSTGKGTTQSGAEVDLSEYVVSVPEEEYFISFDYMNDIAEKYYYDTYGVITSSSSVDTFTADGTVVIRLDSETGERLAAYKLDLRTGVGVDADGNPVDLSGYADYKPAADEDLFIRYALMDDAAREYYIEATGSEDVSMGVSMKESIHMARFVFMDDEGGTIEEYLIDMLTGVGTDSKGETVDLAAFAETHEIENSDYGIDDSGVDESGYFAPSGLISHFAAWDYYEKTGKAVNMTQFSVDEETMIAQIVLSGEEGQLDTYTIDVTTGIGTNQNGDEIDLSVYAETEGSEEDDYIQELMAKLAQKDYQLKTGTEVSGLAWWPGDEEGTLIVTLTDEDDNTLDVYTVQTATGDAVNQAGDQINLNALCPSEEDFFVRSDDIEEYAKMYFIEQNGMEPAGVVADFDVLENTLLIQFVDEASEPIDAYTIDIATGIGHDAVGEAVDLAAYAEAHKIVHWEDEADESEFAAPAHTMLASALYDYCCKYGVEAYTSGTGTDIEFSREPMIVFVRFTSQNGAAEEYTIDFKTGSAVNSSGETVDLLPYALKHEDYLEEALSGMGDYASKDYYLKHGVVAADAVTEEGDSEQHALFINYQFSGEVEYVVAINTDLTITLKDENGNVLDIYIFDLITGTGTNQSGEDVDMYSLIPDMEECFVNAADVEAYAEMYYIEQTGIKPDTVNSDLDFVTSRLELTIHDADETLLEKYDVDFYTGVGTDSAGNPVDLGTYAAEHELQKPEDETGIPDVPIGDDVEQPGETDTETPGEEANLPQTGNNAIGSLLAAIGAFLMLGFGAAAVKLSGIFKRRDEEA